MLYFYVNCWGVKDTTSLLFKKYSIRLKDNKPAPPVTNIFVFFNVELIFVIPLSMFINFYLLCCIFFIILTRFHYEKTSGLKRKLKLLSGAIFTQSLWLRSILAHPLKKYHFYWYSYYRMYNY